MLRYKSKKYAGPNPNSRSYRVKDSDYYLHFAQSILHSYVSGRGLTEIAYNSKRLNTNELYAKGEQGSFAVKEKLLRKNKQTGKHYGKLGQVFDTYDILPEMIGVIKSINMRQDYTVSTIATDDESSSARENEKNKIKTLLDKNIRETLQMLEYKPQSALTEEELEVYTEDDVDTLFSTGGLQLEREINASACVRTTFRISSFKECENRCTENLIKFGIAALRTKTNYFTNEVKCEDIDPRTLIIPASKHNDFRDINYYAIVDHITINELRERVKNLDARKLEEIIRNSADASLNRDLLAYMSTVDDACEGYINGENAFIGDIRISVLECQWLDNDISRQMQFPTKSGGYRYTDLGIDEIVKSRDRRAGAREISKKFVKRYDCLWVIGTDILISYGQAKGNVYHGPQGKRVPRLDISVVKTGEKSLVERCIPHVNDINLYSIKMRSAIAKMPPPVQLHIYEHALRNVVVNGRVKKMDDLIRDFVEDGILITSAYDANGNLVTANGGKSVEIITHKGLEVISGYSAEIGVAVDRLRQVLGLPEGLDGTSGPAYQGLGVKQMVAAASSNALFPVLSRIQPLVEKASESIITAWQALSQSKEVNVRDLVIGERTARMFKLDKGFSNHDFNIRMQYAPTDSEKDFLIEQISELNKVYAQTQGKVGVSRSEFLLLYKLIKGGRIDEAMRTLSKLEKMRERINVQLDQAKLQATIEGQQESAIVANEEQRKTIIAKGEEDRKTVLAKEAMSGVTDLIVQELKSVGQKEGSTDEEVSALTEESIDEIIGRILPVIQQSIDAMVNEGAA